MGFIGFLSRAFMYGASRPEVHGADKFLQLLDERKDVAKRRRGLITGTLGIHREWRIGANVESSVEPYQCVRACPRLGPSRLLHRKILMPPPPVLMTL
jgi:hypothetical protein